MGFSVAVVSGGFTVFTDRLKAELGLDHAHANTLEIVDGRLTGEVVGPIVDRAAQGRAAGRDRCCGRDLTVARRWRSGTARTTSTCSPPSGLGIAFNAKPAVRARAHTTVSVPQLDVILFMLGVRGAEVDHVD